jgi:hypothetical protein
MRWKVIVSSNRLYRGIRSACWEADSGGGRVHELESDIREVEGLFGI